MYPVKSTLSFLASINSDDSNPPAKKHCPSSSHLQDVIINAVCDRKLETNIDVDITAPERDPLNAPFATPAIHDEEIVATSTADEACTATNLDDRQAKSLERSLSSDPALINGSPIQGSGQGNVSFDDGKIGDKTSTPSTDHPSQSSLTSEDSSNSPKQCLPKTDTQRYIEGTIQMLEEKEVEEKKFQLFVQNEPPKFVI